MSTANSSSSLGNRTLVNNPICTCGQPASLRTSTTMTNPGRSFFGCPKYNKQGLPHCNYFKWADISEEIEIERMKIEILRLRNEQELRRREEEILKRELEVHNDRLDIQKQRADIRHERTLLRSYCVILILIVMYFVRP
ncbi:uncharacterized protein LOC122318919 [Carya illinoinensis]|nr:uncharacterized protein LOC122280666 isoform X2 [Carya illinoinensis]XP_042992607.1 uncharacterized protein LOC122318919 [Carya illinoinensis]